MDVTIFNFLQNFAGKIFFVDATGIVLAKYIPYLLLVGVLIFTIRESTWQKRIFSTVFILLTGLLSRGLLIEIIREVYYRSRPLEVLTITPLFEKTTAAFPSGHATLAFALAFAIFLFNRKWGSWFLGFALLNGLARIFAGVHWPTDILGGIAVGFIGFLLVYLLLEKPFKILYKEKGEEENKVDLAED